MKGWVVSDHFDAALDTEVIEVLARADAAQQTTRHTDLYGMVRYHLGLADASFAPARLDTGKRVRPRLCILVCDALGGDTARAYPVAAAIELIHNFTLIHDDIQDNDLIRRHRQTVHAIWGTAQGINAGDAAFALAQQALLRCHTRGVPAETVLLLLNELLDTTLRIVEGQTADISFEERWPVPRDEYEAMIRAKTAVILGYACWAGAVVAGANVDTANEMRALGMALGRGFQQQDDVLGIWGDPAVTGKAAGNDIRRRKKSLPIILLSEQVAPADLELLASVYEPEAVHSQADLSDARVAQIMDLLTRHEVRDSMQAHVEEQHDNAMGLLQHLPQSAARDQLAQLAETLATRIA